MNNHLSIPFLSIPFLHLSSFISHLFTFHHLSYINTPFFLFIPQTNQSFFSSLTVLISLPLMIPSRDRLTKVKCVCAVGWGRERHYLEPLGPKILCTTSPPLCARMESNVSDNYSHTCISHRPPKKTKKKTRMLRKENN